jgi:hypothetical protein
MPKVRRRMVVLAGLALAMVAGGAVVASGDASQSVTPISITGGTRVERGLLKAIVHRMAPHQVASLRIGPVPREWGPQPGDVELIGHQRPLPGERFNLRGDWEIWLLGGAFRDRSKALGQPRVLVVGGDFGAERVQPNFADPPMADPAGLPAYTSQVTALARASGAHIVSISTGRPDGYSADVTLQVAHPVWFLKHRVDALLEGLDKLHSDGTFLQLYESGGKPLLVTGGSTRLQSGLLGVEDPVYLPCIDFFFPIGGFGLAPPLPCPSTWRPPPSTPPRRLHLYGWEAGGQALGTWNGRAGISVAYRPGATFGLGLVLANPNGHPVTIKSITTDVPTQSSPIGYTGARIQIPVSRDRPGGADQLQAPYTPEPPFAPFTVQPGDWFGVGLHYAVLPACTTANAGTAVTVNRHLTVTYTLEGRTVRSTYTNVPLSVTYPATCPAAAAAQAAPAPCAPVRRLSAAGRVTTPGPIRVRRFAGGAVVTWTRAARSTAGC